MNTKTFARRRRGVMQLMGDGCVAIIPSGPELLRNGDVQYNFRPDSNFYYLSHFPEPDAVLVLIPGREQGEYVLFCREKDLDKEIWHGYREGLEGAVEHYAADDAYPIDDIDEILPGLLENRIKIYYSMGHYPDFDSRLIQWVNQVKTRARSGVAAPTDFVDLGIILHELRLLKRAEELRIMRRAAKLTVAAHQRAMQLCRPGMKEYQLQAELEYVMLQGGSRSPAYPSIVAGGSRALVLHYTENQATLEAGELLLIDAGAEVDCYAADITRTFPVSGRFTAEQKAVYDIVLAAHQVAVEHTCPGKLWNDAHEAALQVLVTGMVDLGLLQGEVEGLIESGAYKRYFMHRTGHWLGMDVHDVGDYKVEGAWRPLEPGMISTVEPGLYIAPAADIAERWHNIAIRIEDDVLVTRDGYEVLTQGLARTTADIEAFMAA